MQLGRRAGAGITIVINTLHCIQHVWVHCIGSAWKLNVQLGRRAEVWAHYICAARAIEGAGITIVINTLHCIKHFWVHCVGSAWKLNMQLGRRAEVWAHYICAAWAKGWRGWYYYSNKHFALH